MKPKILVLVLVFFIACATAPKPRQIVSSFQIDASFDSTWSALIETFAELQLPIQNMEKDSGLITTDWIDFSGQTNEDYCDCGGLGMFVETNRLGRFNVFVKKITDNSCEVKVNCMFEQNYSSLDRTNRYKRKCVSTGNLEAEMFRLIKEKVQ